MFKEKSPESRLLKIRAANALSVDDIASLSFEKSEDTLLYATHLQSREKLKRNSLNQTSFER